MSADLTFIGAGLTAQVLKAKPSGIGQAGIAFAAVPCPQSGAPMLSLTIIHPDGTALSVLLDECLVHRSAENMADFVDALPAIQSEARH